MQRSEDRRFEFRKRRFHVCIEDLFEARITKEITLGAGCFRDAVSIDKEPVPGGHRNRKVPIECIRSDSKGYVNGRTIALNIATGRPGKGPGLVGRSQVQYRGVSGIKDARFTLPAVVSDNCRCSHCIQAMAANQLVNLPQDGLTVEISHVSSQRVVYVLAHFRDGLPMADDIRDS